MLNDRGTVVRESRIVTQVPCQLAAGGYTDVMKPDPRRLARPMLWLLMIALVSVLMPLLMLALLPIVALLWLAAVPLAIWSPSFGKDVGLTPLAALLSLPLWILLIVSSAVPALAAAHAGLLHLDAQAPSQLPGLLDGLARQLPESVRRLAHWLELGRADWARFCIAAGAAGFAANCAYAVLDVPWRLKQMRMVRALPRSRVRSAAAGLAEFEGIARRVSYAKRDGQPEMQPFYLEDETGRIRVDPRGVMVRPWGASGAALQANEVEDGIRDGDRVYVIGHVQPLLDEPAQAPRREGLVVRPLRQSLVASPVARLFLGKAEGLADRQTPNLFIVDKGRERDITLRLRTTLWDFCVVSAVYLAASLWLVHAAWKWLD